MNKSRYYLLLFTAVVFFIIAICTPHIQNPREFLAGMCVIVSTVCVFGMFWTLIEKPTINTIKKIKYFLFEKRATK